MPTTITLPDDIAEQLKYLPNPELFITNLLRAALQCRQEHSFFPDEMPQTPLETIKLSQRDITLVVEALETPIEYNNNEALKKALLNYQKRYEN